MLEVSKPQKVCEALIDNFRLTVLCNTLIVYNQVKRDKSLGIELLDTEEDHSDDPVEVGKWSSYMQKYVSSADTSEDLKEEMSKKPVFLKR